VIGGAIGVLIAVLLTIRVRRYLARKRLEETPVEEPPDAGTFWRREASGPR
jgi:hypothetical protein